MAKKLDLAKQVARLVTNDLGRFRPTGEHITLARDMIVNAQLDPAKILSAEPVLDELANCANTVEIRAFLIVLARKLRQYERAATAAPELADHLVALHWLLTDPGSDSEQIQAPALPWIRSNKGPPSPDYRSHVAYRTLDSAGRLASRWLEAVDDAVAVQDALADLTPDGRAAYRPAKEIQMLDPAFTPDLNHVRRRCTKHGIRTYKPSDQRLLVHAGDWVRIVAERKEAAEQEETAVERRKNEAKAEKQRREAPAD